MLQLLIIFISFIQKATFYPKGALIEEIREVKVRKGYNILKLKFLPIIDENSFQIEFNKGEIINTEIERKMYLKYRGNLKILQDSFDLLTNIIDSLKIKKENLKQAKSFLDSFKSSYSEKESKEFLEKKFDPLNIKKALKTLIEEGTRIEREIKGIDKKIDELEWIKGKIDGKLRRYYPIGKENLFLKIHLDSKTEGKVKLKIKYFLLSKCGYEPRYKIIGNPEKGNIEIKMFAKVYQFTGENFDNFELSISTLKPGRVIKPFTEKWKISSKYLRKEHEAREVLAIKVPSAAPKEKEVKPIEEKELYTSFHYTFPYKVTLPSSEEGKVFFVKNFILPSSFEYQIIPRKYKSAFLKSKSFIKIKEPLLRGIANLFLNQEYVGQKEISGFYPGDTMEFYFGEDPFVKVDHNLIKSEIEKKGIMNKKVVHKLGYKTVIKNERKNKIKGTLIENVPVSLDPEIKIKNIKFSKKPFKVDKPKGLYYFKFELEPGESYEIEYYFEIISPRDRRIYGL